MILKSTLPSNEPSGACSPHLVKDASSKVISHNTEAIVRPSQLENNNKHFTKTLDKKMTTTMINQSPPSVTHLSFFNT